MRKSRDLDDRAGRARPRRGLAPHPRCRDAADPRGARASRRGGTSSVTDIGFPSHVLTPRDRPVHRTLYYVPRRRLHGADRRLPRPLRHPAGRRDRRPGRDARLPARARAHVEGLPRRARRRRRALGRHGGRRGAGRRLGRRRARPVDGALDARPRPAPRRPPRDARAVGGPHHLDARDPRRSTRSTRGCSSSKVQAYAEWWAGSADGPRPSRGLARARRPRRAAEGPDALRHPRPARPRLPAAGAAGRRGRLGPDRDRGAGPDPRLRAAALRPREPRAPSARSWSSCDEGACVAGFDELAPRTAYDVWRLRQQVFVVEQDCPYPDLDGRDLEDADPARGAARRRGRVIGILRVLDDGGWARIGRVVVAPAARGRGLAALMMDEAMAAVRRPRGAARRPDRADRLLRGLRLRGDGSGVRRGRGHARADGREGRPSTL